MHTVQIQLKSRDFRIPGFHLDLKIVYEFQLWSRAVQSVAGGRYFVRPALLLFFSGLMLPDRSGQIPETVALYYTPTKH
jgi:hypothetical protein